MFNQTGTFFDAAVDLPDGARVVSITWQHIDSSATGNGSGELWSFDAAGTVTLLASGNTGAVADTPGSVSTTQFVDHTITLNENILVRIWGTNGSGVESCGVKVGYIPPVVATDVIYVDNFLN